jgi:hypothetical protein
MALMDATIIWDDEPGQNVDHIAENGLTPDEVDEVLLDDSIPTANTSLCIGTNCATILG